MTSAYVHMMTTDPASWKISNGHIFATGHPIHFVFGSRVWFSAVSGSNGATSGCAKSEMAAAILKNFEWPYLFHRSSDPVRVWF